MLCGQVVFNAYLRLRILKTCSGPSLRYKMPHELNLQLRLCQHTISTSKSAIAMRSVLLTCQARLTSKLGSSLHPACQTVQTMLSRALLHSVATKALGQCASRALVFHIGPMYCLVTIQSPPQELSGRYAADRHRG